VILLEYVEENVRVFRFDKNDIYLKRDGQTGFWNVNFEKGELPEVLKQSFTNLDSALPVIKNYLESVRRAKFHPDGRPIPQHKLTPKRGMTKKK
jgi:hypothetical protein